ncbi:cytochrome P450 [Amycolatopsis rhabdoformis]|uniref:Cytochrome P450 n=1 Tax=Amycolatopsis rhabdoformis TaxID=1448059 RepID=A0ABZ1IFR2_9PSEU|nr:cytochrome P450 [Amycolatopsis rhabdoformis]WSE33252.1 cytochrome P450 [Amycolatopsis rhabdoformis]
MSAPARFNPLGAAFRADPYPQYRQLRETRPVHKTLGMWVLTRHEDVQRVLRDRSFSAGLIPRLVTKQAERTPGIDVTRIEQLGRKSLVFTDNPDHARLRGLVNRVFTAPAVATLRPLVEKVAGELLDRTATADGFDAIDDFAAPLPVAVLSQWLALPDDLRAQVGRWTHDIRFLLEPGLMRGDDFTHVCAVVEQFVAALEEVLRERRAHPGDDLVSRLLATETGGGDRLADEELIFVCVMCFVAGNETTKSLIGNGLVALARHPEQAALLRRRPELVRAAVQEMLRYDCPLQLTKRLATRDVEIGGATVREGDQVLLCLGAANRDPEVFARPEEFDVTRDAKGHLAFGHGMHGCLGGLLAELQAEVAFEQLLRRAGHFTPDVDEIEYQDHSFIVRGPRHLPLSLGGAR